VVMGRTEPCNAPLFESPHVRKGQEKGSMFDSFDSIALPHPSSIRETRMFMIQKARGLRDPIERTGFCQIECSNL
jgi:hypothetical protein